MAGDTSTLSKPALGSDVSVRIPEGAAPSLAFPLSEIREFHLTASGALEIRLEGNSLLVIENFRDLAARGAKISVPNGPDLDTNLVYNTLASGTTPKDSTALYVPQPEDTGEHAYSLEAGRKYILGFTPSIPQSTSKDGGALVFNFPGGATVILKNFAAVGSEDLPPAMTLADGITIPANRLPGLFGLGVPGEDASAETVAAKTQTPDADALKVAAIEPAAGPSAQARTAAPAGQQRGPVSNSGYGLNSSPDDVSLTPIDPVGPINPTALEYRLPLYAPDIYGLPEPRESEPLPPLAPTLAVRDATVFEDGSTGLDLSVQPSEPGTTLTVTIGGIPNTWTVSGPGTYDPATQTWTITVPPGTPFPGGPVLSPPANSDEDLTGLVVTVTEKDPSTDRSTTITDTLDVITDAVADAPDVNAQGATGLEDTPLPLAINPALTDTDGSETVAAIYVRNVPAGFTLSTGTNLGGGVWQLTPAQLSGLTLSSPPNFSGSVPLEIEVISRETNLSGSEPDLTNNEASTFQTVTMTWHPVADAPELSVRDAQVKEDGTVFVPISATLTDRDGSEALSLTVTGVPVGWSFTGTGWVATGTPGEWRISMPAGTDYTGGFTLKPPANSDADIGALRIRATSTEGENGDVASTSQTIKVITDAVADKPTITADDSSGLENTARPITFHAALTDLDGSEAITGYKISGVPAGFSFNQGTNLGGGVWSFTPAQITGLKMTSPAGFVGSVPLTATVLSGETVLSGGEYDPADNTAQASDPFCVTWTPVANPPTVQVNNGVDDAVVKEDGSVFVPIKAALDPAGSGNEILTVTVTGINPAWTVLNTDGTYNASTGIWTITLPAGTNYTGGLTFKPPANSDADLSGLVAKATAFEPATSTSAFSTDAFRIVTDAVADAPNLSASDASGEEGTTIPLSISTSVTDTDGSETIAFVRISGLPAGTSLNHGTLVSPGVWEVTPAQIAGLGVVVPNGVTGAFTLGITSYARETNLSGSEVDLTDNTASKTVRIKLCVDADDVPIILQPERISVDESNLGPITVNDAITANFGADVPGAFRATGVSSFAASGSLRGGALTSGGVAIAVTLAGNVYTGKAGAETIFTLMVQPDGQYQFKLLGTLDHADGANPNDVIALRFGITATDSDGDPSTGFITVNVADDALIAHNDLNTFRGSEGPATGNVITGLHGGPGAADDLSNDSPNTVTKITFGSTTVNVPSAGTATIDGLHGTLSISADGSYSYRPFDDGNYREFAPSDPFPALPEGVAVGASDLDLLGLNATDLDLSGPTVGKVTFVSEGAGYSNTLGFYTVDATGTLRNPGIVIRDGNHVAAGTAHNFAIPGSGAGQSVGFFLIADGFTLNSGYGGIDFNAGDLSFIYKRGTASERPAKITDSSADISLVFTQDGTGDQTILKGPVYHATERGATNTINPDGLNHVISGLPNPTNPTVLRIGFEDLPRLGDKDYNDMVFDLSIRPACGTDAFRYTLADSDGDTSTALLTLQCQKPSVTVDVSVNKDVDDAVVKEDGSVFIPVSASIGHGDGDETMTLTLDGVGAGWTLTGTGWTATGTPGQFKITLPQGADYTGGFTLKPPANSDVDLGGLKITATISDPNGGPVTGSDAFRIITDAVADKPNVSATGATGTEDTALPLVISAAVADTDGSESLKAIYVRDLPAGFSLSAGMNLGGGVWQLTSAQLAGLKVLSPANFSGQIALRVEAVSQESTLSGVEKNLTDNTASTIQTVSLKWNPVADAPTLTTRDVVVKEDGSIFVPVSAALVDRDGSEALSVTVSGVPSGWAFTGTGWATTGTPGSWKISMPAGSDYTGGFTLKPPANSDVDIGALQIKATSTESATGASVDTLHAIRVTTDAVADKPDLCVGSPVFKGTDGCSLTFCLDIQTNVTDKDGSESIEKIIVSGLPSGWTLSAGTHQASGEWVLSKAQLAGLELFVPVNGSACGSYEISVTSWSKETFLSGTEVDYTDNKAWSTETVCFDLNVNNFTGTQISVSTDVYGLQDSSALYGGAGDLLLPDVTLSLDKDSSDTYSLSDYLHVSDDVCEAINGFVYGSHNVASGTVSQTVSAPAANLLTAFDTAVSFSGYSDILKETALAA